MIPHEAQCSRNMMQQCNYINDNYSNDNYSNDSFSKQLLPLPLL